MAKIIVTGFKPFLDYTDNPTELVIHELQKLIVQNKTLSEVQTLVLPVTFADAYKVLSEEITTDTEYVIMLGLSGPRPYISLEKIALNWIESSRPDNSGIVAKPSKINTDAELALMTNYPINDFHDYLKKECGIQNVEISFSAGTYVCNYLYYNVLAHHSKIKSLFIHMPLQDKNITLNLLTKVALEAIKFIQH